MAILKAINRGPRNTHASLRASINYVLQDNKTTQQFKFVDGPYDYSDITAENVYTAFLEEKNLWGKDSGKMCAHYVLSFHKDEAISPAAAFEFGKVFYEKIFDGYQFVMAIHLDRDHVHAHAIVNSVSYIDGKKLHVTDSDLASFKKLCNAMCLERGFSVARKGYHFDGSKIEAGEIISWDKATYSMLKYHPSNSYKASCMVAVNKSLSAANDVSSFISLMNEQGWVVNWAPAKKHITFENKKGFKIRNSTLGKIMNTNLSKEAIINECRRNKIRNRQQQSNSTRPARANYINRQNKAGEHTSQASIGGVIGSICAGVAGAAFFLASNTGESDDAEQRDTAINEGIPESKHHFGNGDEEESQRLHM